jgi:hypothetical protein
LLIKKSKYGILLHGRKKISGGKKVITWLKKHLAFDKNKDADIQLKESTRALKNPGCGWYHIYTFNLSKENFLYIDCEEEELALLLIDIHAFRGCEQIPKEALEYFSSILTFFEQHDKGIILRIVYDTKGRGMENEPSSIKIVKSHMKQLGSIICEHMSKKESLPGKILVHQGLFVGSWGEMHGSKFLSEARMKELSDTFLEATKGSCPIAVRKPVQLRQLSCKKTASSPLQNASNMNFTLFNDAIFGSETDLGTYGTILKSALSENSEREKTSWAREDELSWQQSFMQQSFCGGEVLGGMNIVSESSGNTDHPQRTIDWHQVVADFAKMHVSYLNSIYSKEVLDDWKAQRIMWNGEEISEYDYIGRHMGYRFTVTQVKISKNVITLTIKNTGFANLCEEAVCRLILIENNENVKAFEIKSDPRTWNSCRDTVIENPILQEVWTQQSQQTKLFLQLIRKRDGRIIEWANEEYDHKAGGVRLLTKL